MTSTEWSSQTPTALQCENTRLTPFYERGEVQTKKATPAVLRGISVSVLKGFNSKIPASSCLEQPTS